GTLGGDRVPLRSAESGREPGAGLHVRLLHLLQELPGVGGEALHVASLALGVEGVEGEAALAGAGGTGDHDQPVPWQVAVDSLQVVDPGPPDRDRFVPGRFHGASDQRTILPESGTTRVPPRIARAARACYLL